MRKAGGYFYGWWIVVALAVMTFTSCWTIFSIVLKQLMEQFQTGRGEVSLAQSISIITGSVAGMLAGKLVSRYKPRTFMLWGSVINGVCLLLLSQSPNLWYFYVFSCLSGIATGFSGVIVTFTLLSRWFTRKWGFVVGLAQAVGFIGIMAMTPMVGLIAGDLGWRAAYLFVGLLVLAINVPLILFVTKDSPQSLGLLPDGDRPEDITSPASAQLLNQTAVESTRLAKNTGLLASLKNPALWLICLCFAFIGIGYGVVTTHEVAFITDMNISATAAASALGFTIGLTAVASLAAGWMANRLSSRYVAILFNILAVAGMLILLRADTMPKVWLFVVLFGLGVGASGTLLPIVTRDIFGTANFSTLFGFTNVSFGVGFAAGAPLAGFLFDATGSYQLVFIIVMAMFAGAILAIYFAFGARPKPLMRVSISGK